MVMKMLEMVSNSIVRIRRPLLAVCCAAKLKRGTVAGYLKWVYTIGQKIAQEKGYAILPPEVLEKVVAQSATIR
jgi:ABC-type phosphate transport system substrate-binding protein